jgi:hypothetical protein
MLQSPSLFVVSASVGVVGVAAMLVCSLCDVCPQLCVRLCDGGVAFYVGKSVVRIVVGMAALHGPVVIICESLFHGAGVDCLCF